MFEEVLSHISSESRSEMEEAMVSWKERGRGGSSLNLDGTPLATATSSDGEGSLPLGPGEWTEPLGLPLCVVCQNVSIFYYKLVARMLTCVQAQKIEFLEKNKAWKEPDFDAVLQYLRTVLLRRKYEIETICSIDADVIFRWRFPHLYVSKRPLATP